MNRRMRPDVRACVCATMLLTVFLAALLTEPDCARAATVFVDPGHGGRYSNANLPSLGIYEKNVNLAIGLALRDALEARGHTVVLSRTTDTAVGTTDIPTWKYTSETDLWAHYADGTTYYADGVPKDDLQARCDLANRAGADIFISVHNNGATSASAHGFENFASDEDLLGIRLSRLVQQHVIAETPLGDRGADEMDFYVVKWSHMPAVLIEGGFLTNAFDRAFVTSWSGRTALARAVANAVDEFLATEPFQPVWPRIAGGDRYATAVALSQTGWPEIADTVLLTTGRNWPDALASAPLSRKLDAPLLLTDPSVLPTSTAEEIARLRPRTILVLGGEDAVSSEVASAAASVCDTESPAGLQRIAGADRYETAALIAAEVGVPEDGRVVVVNGETPADAVSIAPYAGSRLIPILLAQPSRIPTPVAAFQTAAGPSWVYTIVPGGQAAVSDAVVNHFPTPVRVAGPDRYATNIAVIERYFPDTVRLYVSSGTAVTDNLTSGALGAKDGHAMLLVEPRTISNHTRLFIENNEHRIGSFTMVGGTNAVPYLHDWILRKALR